MVEEELIENIIEEEQDMEDINEDMVDPRDFSSENYNQYISDATDIEGISQQEAIQLWNGLRSDDDELDKIKRKKEIAESKKVFIGDVIRKNGSLYIRIKVAPEIEEWFEAKCAVKKSNSWKEGSGYHRFYHYETIGGEAKRFISRRFNNYGTHYFDSSHNKVNVAVIRTVGIGDEFQEFVMDDQYSKETLLDGMRQLRDFTKELWQNYIKPVRVHSEASIFDYVD